MSNWLAMSWWAAFNCWRLWFLEIALVFLRFDHIARFIINANHCIV